jgi:hypothetical protein
MPSPFPKFWLETACLVLAGMGFIGFNFVLWSLPLTQLQLFLISVPLGAAAFAAFLWYLLLRE